MTRKAQQTLADPERQTQRKSMLSEAHMLPLTRFIEQIRTEQPDKNIPYFDPADAGTEAEVLFVLEAPGPRAKESGFVSCDNNDQTAGNLKELLEQAGINRKQTALWNIVPWYLGNGKKIAAANRTDTSKGRDYLKQVITLLPRLRAIVFVGRPAQREAANLELPSMVQRFESFHPSLSFINHDPVNNRERILQAFREVADFLRQ